MLRSMNSVVRNGGEGIRALHLEPLSFRVRTGTRFQSLRNHSWIAAVRSDRSCNGRPLQKFDNSRLAGTMCLRDYPATERTGTESRRARSLGKPSTKTLIFGLTCVSRSH